MKNGTFGSPRANLNEMVQFPILPGPYVLEQDSESVCELVNTVTQYVIDIKNVEYRHLHGKTSFDCYYCDCQL